MYALNCETKCQATIGPVKASVNERSIGTWVYIPVCFEIVGGGKGAETGRKSKEN